MAAPRRAGGQARSPYSGDDHRPDPDPSVARGRASIEPDVTDLRRRLHRIPEVGLQLPLTQAVVIAALREIGLEPVLGRSVSSVVATIEGSGPGPTILLRADMDGLPLSEDTGLPFASEHDGRMHACAHDTHMAMLIGAARLLVARRADWRGRVLLMFQPGEEGVHGARYMLEEGLLDAAGATPPSGAFALHTMGMYPSGTINIRPGPMLAAGDTLHVTIEGRGGHASMPHRAVDPVTVAAEMVLAFQTMVGRRIDVFDPAVVTIAQMAAGTTTNVIAESAYLGGTMRSVSEATRLAVRAEVRRVAEGVAAAHGAGVQVAIEPGYPVTVNDPGFTDMVLHESRRLVGEDEVRVMPAPIMGAEDFSYVLAAGARGHGLPRRPAAESRSGDGPGEPFQPGRLRRVGDVGRRRDARGRRAAPPRGRLIAGPDRAPGRGRAPSSLATLATTSPARPTRADGHGESDLREQLFGDLPASTLWFFFLFMAIWIFIAIFGGHLPAHRHPWRREGRLDPPDLHPAVPGLPDLHDRPAEGHRPATSR